MADKTTQKSASPREYYRKSCERVAMIMKLYGAPHIDSPTLIQNDRDFDAIKTMLSQVSAAQQLEEINDYRNVIVDVASWVAAAYSKEFINCYASRVPRPLYVIKKGLEILHLLLHRDLRRRQLSATESQLYYDFRKLISSLNDPRITKTESFIEDQYVRKSS